MAKFLKTIPNKPLLERKQAKLKKIQYKDHCQFEKLQVVFKK